MFSRQIEKAKNFIKRIHISRDSNNEVPDSVKVRGTELRVWHNVTKNLILRTFGNTSSQLQNFTEIQDSQGEIIDRLIKMGDDKWEFNSSVDYFHLMIGLLEEFQAVYNDTRSIKEKGGDIYNISGQVGAVGPQSKAESNKFEQKNYKLLKK